MQFDVVIIGGGPAGISAAIWCVEYGLSHIVLEKANEIGGQLNWIHNRISNYPGVDVRNGVEMLERFRSHADGVGCNILTRSAVLVMDVNAHTVTLTGGEEIGYRSLIIATGVRRRTLNVPGEIEFAGKGILASGAGELDKVEGKKVVIVGGGDAALENAVMMAETASSVIVVHRSDIFRARTEFIEKAKSFGNVQLVTNTHVTGFLGDEVLRAVEVENSQNLASKIMADLALIRIGVVPNTDDLTFTVRLDADGFVSVDSTGRTDIKGIFAIGDVAHPGQLTLVSASFTASSAVRAALSDRENSGFTAI
jgi:thioredoxin reductase (NADPH)